MSLVYVHTTRDSVEKVNAVPICRKDFCDGCGDCLDCYAEDPCPDGHHSWVVYEWEADQWRADHPEAKPWAG